MGLLGGYNINSRWAVETGLIWDRKAYASEGAYFKTDKIYLPEHSDVVSVAGYCNMFEIPLNLRFNMAKKRSHTVFATAGVSSYLMQKEDYDYVYRRYNVDYAGNKKVYGNSNHLFSVANFSVGYEQGLGRKTKLRIEPYLKIPVKGVGIGSLPLSSAGILFGITHPIH